jgi:NAD(P)-dependent dehydrogenase (short-subunit alcohol dehydrogenase family)
MHIAEQVVVVTGAARGLGRELVDAVLARGATKVYAAARNPSAVRADHSSVT